MKIYVNSFNDFARKYGTDTFELIMERALRASRDQGTDEATTRRKKAAFDLLDEALGDLKEALKTHLG